MAQRTGYSFLQIALHSTIAALVAVQFLFHDSMEDAFDTIVDGGRPRLDELLGAWVHAAVGLTILTLVRLIVRTKRGAPPAHRDKPAFLVWIAHATHFALYGFILFMPVAGAVAWFGRIDDVGDVHSLAATLLLPLIGLHAPGAYCGGV